MARSVKPIQMQCLLRGTEVASRTCMDDSAPLPKPHEFSRYCCVGIACSGNADVLASRACTAQSLKSSINATQ